jgi:hypothetical protein
MVRRCRSDVVALPWDVDMVDGSGVVVEKGQTVVVVMSTRKGYRARRKAIEQLVEAVAMMLDQEAMAVIVSKASDGYLLFPDEG